MMVFSLEKSIMLKANFSPELGFVTNKGNVDKQLILNYVFVFIFTLVITERRKRYSE